MTTMPTEKYECPNCGRLRPANGSVFCDGCLVQKTEQPTARGILQGYWAAMPEWARREAVTNPRAHAVIHHCAGAGKSVAELGWELARVLVGALQEAEERRLDAARKQMPPMLVLDEEGGVRGAVEPLAPSAGDLVQAVLDCAEEELQARLSGLESGFEHPSVRALFDKAHAIAKIMRPGRRGLAEGEENTTSEQP